jgi:protein SCO1
MILPKHPGTASLLAAVLAVWVLIPGPQARSESFPQTSGSPRVFTVKGVVTELKPESGMVVIHHEAVPGYMDAMTMPFRAKNRDEMAGLKAGEHISFRLQVTETESWIEHITRIGDAPEASATAAKSTEAPPVRPHHPLLDYGFTNELGQAVKLADFHGQALAITFFFTRCPIPDFCPRLSKNFEEASQKIAAISNAPTNWHFLSISFDPQFDTPAVLKGYAERYHYDPKHWSFLTGPADKLKELAGQSDVTFERDGGSFNHNFRTLIIDAAGHMQMVFPTSGDLSDAITAEILKAAAVTNRPS